MTKRDESTDRRRKRSLIALLLLLIVFLITVGVQIGRLDVGNANAKGDSPPPPAGAGAALPAPTITSKPSNPSYSTSASFAYTHPSSAAFTCSLDGFGFAPCGGPGTSGSTSYTGLALGSHTFRVQATVGTQTSMTSYTWSVAVVPAPTITAKPSNPSFESTVSFSYSDTVSAATFQCKLDADPFAACPGTGSGSTSYSGLTGGSHTFSVRALTEAALTGSATSYTWTFAPPPPTPDITSTPADPTNATTASFGFTDTQAGVQFRCSLDGAAFAACTSQKSYSNLSDGWHTFQVKAVDASNTASGPASFTWLVDTKPPVVTLAFPDDNGLYTAAAWNGGCASAGLCGTATDPAGIQRVQLSIKQVSTGRYWNGSSFAAGLVFVNAPGTTWSYGFAAGTFPADGDYAVDVRATDNAGNTTAANRYAQAAFTLDTTPPPAPTFKRTPNNPNTARDAHFEVQDAEKGVKYSCSLDGGPYESCGDDIRLKDLAPGAHTFCVKAIDKAGNRSAATCFTWQEGSGLGNLTISGNVVGLLYPGGVARPLAVKLTNPNGVAVTVSTLTVTLVPGSFPAGCLSGDFVIAPSNVSAGTPITVPAGGSVTLPNATNAPGVTAPTIRMKNTNVSQDHCKGATFTFDYSSSS